MQSVRQRALFATRGALLSANPQRPAMRAYASDHGHHDAPHDHHHHAPEVNESPGLALYTALGAVGASMLVYSISRPTEDGEPSVLRKWIDQSRKTGLPKWEERNTLRTDFYEQAAQDKNLFKSVQKSDFQYRTPELLNSGCPNNVPAGHGVNLDHIVEHYRKLHLDQEERKAKKLAQVKTQ